MRIIVSKEDIKGERVTVSGEKAKYLISVMRCEEGDSLQVLDGEGNCYNAKVSGIDNKKVTLDLLEKVPYETESHLNLELVQGILKGEKMDWVIQKTTELGVKEIVPVITERSQVRHTRKVERWKKIAEEASRQSGRTNIPVIQKPVEFSSWLIAHGSLPLNGFIFWEEGGLPLKEAVSRGVGDWGLGVSSFTNPRTQNPNPCFIAIGPEGGFTKEEVELANSKGLITVSLGKRILRAETAAISAVTLIQFLLGDINQG
ncbi:MAG: 16S rRNA (uracil(1498)-N(3))-methyltransferase [Nitrospirae bacterium]|nr:MAG: 16S rRNA (uracil(1498)-N(3))-methyltransferase [Nitrospirota bacterium]